MSELETNNPRSAAVVRSLPGSAALNAVAVPTRAPLVFAQTDSRLEGAAWVTMHCHSFSVALLGEMRDLFALLSRSGATWAENGTLRPLHYVVLNASHSRIFSLGGDLRHFHACISKRDERALREYSMQCLDMLFDWATRFNDHATTIALVQGRALGGGFEAALSADFLVAEEHAEFGFPEITFGLFPCTGAMSLLARRIGPRQAERMMTDGRIYSARELHQMGIVDTLCPRGQGESSVRAFISEHSRKRDARLALQRARRRHAPLDYSELATVVEDWVRLALRLEPDNLRAMEMLSRLQESGLLTG